MKNDESVFIKNNRQYQSNFVVKTTKLVDDGEGNKTKRAVIKFTKSFEPLRTDPVTGNVLTTGYTEVSKSEFEDLKKLRVFAEYIKKGSFVCYDEAPADALLDAQLVNSLRRENKSLRSRIAELEKLASAVNVKDKEDTGKKKTKKKEEPAEEPAEEPVEEAEEDEESSETPEF